VRAELRQLLQQAPEVQVVGEAASGEDARVLVAETSADPLILDMDMPGLTGVEVARQLRAPVSPVRILALGAYDHVEYIPTRARHGGRTNWRRKMRHWGRHRTSAVRLSRMGGIGPVILPAPLWALTTAAASRRNRHGRSATPHGHQPDGDEAEAEERLSPGH
jgi:hypothetical protein